MMNAIRRFRRMLGALARERRGNVLMIFGFALVPLIAATGMGIDYSNAMRLQTKLDAAADAASLAATTTPMLQQTMNTACTAATNMFVQQSQGLNGLTLDTTNPANLTITMTETYGASGSTPVTATCGALPASVVSAAATPVSRVATVTYRGTSANNFGGILGISTLTVKGQSGAQVGLATYFQIVFAIDVSNSMGIGGTSTDVNNLNGDPQISCAFACHDPNHTGSSPQTASSYCEGTAQVTNSQDQNCRTNQNYCPPGQRCTVVYPSVTYADKRGLARSFGYKLKIDYVNDAVASFISSMKQPMQNAPNNYLVSIYTFGTGTTFGNGAYAPIQPPTTNWSTLNAASGKIDLETAAQSPSGYGNQGWTYTTAGLQKIQNSLTNVGDGSSPTARKTYVIFISDGVEDTFDATNALGMYNRQTTYNYAAQCQTIKNAGITMFSIEAAYPVIPNDSQYNVLVANLPSRNGGKQITDVMSGCASGSDKYYMASDGPGIKTAVTNIFAAISAQASRITK